MALTLTRTEGEELLIGTNIVVRVRKISGGRVKIEIDAPREVKVMRGELVQEPKQ